MAGAGTGKTTVITRRIAWLIAQKKARPEEILALTFTDKAAADAETVALALEATARFGLTTPDIHMGDVGLFAALLGSLQLAPAWQRLLLRVVGW